MDWLSRWKEGKTGWQKGYEVTGVELSEVAVRAFFEETGLSFDIQRVNGQTCYRARNHKVNIICGDYFGFSDTAFDALYDRASLIALPEQIRPQYIRHTKQLLKPDAKMLLVTLEYDQSVADGPPFSVQAEEVRRYWPNAHRLDVRDDIDDCPPKFRQAGIAEFLEVVWLND